MKLPKTRIKKRKITKRAGDSKSNSTKKKKKALEKINKATIKLKRKQEPCAICLEKIAKKDRIETKCGHFFHKNCLQGWCIQKVKEEVNCFCPVCKTDLIVQTKEAKKKIEEDLKSRQKPLVASPGARERIREIREQSARQLQEIDTTLAELEVRRQERERRRQERALRQSQRANEAPAN